MGDAVLSQAEIDSLLNTQKEAPAAKPAAVASVPGPPRMTVPATPAAVRADRLSAELQQRLEDLEAEVKKAAGLEADLIEARAAIARLQQGMQALTTHLQAVTGQLQAVSDNLQGTPGYSLQKTFTCGSCHNTGFVATLIRCTACGKESWWGYWPPQK